jgi:hypothetical protein
MNVRTSRPRGVAGGGRQMSPGLNDPGSSGADDRIAALEARLSGLERDTSMRARGRGMLDRMMPPEASQHFRNAGREQLMGIRAIVDHWIRRIDDSEKRSAGSRETIDVE